MECGEEFVVVPGIVVLPELCVDNWGTVSTQVKVNLCTKLGISSLVSRPPPLFVLQFAFSIYSTRKQNFHHSSASVYYILNTELKRGRPGNEAEASDVTCMAIDYVQD